jgi:endogenous inhibitor of DNA gyrase (YacG/DUF329 family)
MTRSLFGQHSRHDELVPLPATYERAADGEIVHVRPYCSLDCQATDQDAPADAEREDVGGEEMAGQGNQCCGCGVEL